VLYQLSYSRIRC